MNNVFNAVNNLASSAVATQQEQIQPQRPKTLKLVIIGIVVCAIIIVVLFIIPLISAPRARSAAKEAATRGNMAAINTALVLYNIENGQYPQDLSGLKNDRYLEKIPTDGWGKDYIYRVKSSQEFELFSTGPDGAEGTEDDIYNNY